MIAGIKGATIKFTGEYAFGWFNAQKTGRTTV